MHVNRCFWYLSRVLFLSLAESDDLEWSDRNVNTLDDSRDAEDAEDAESTTFTSSTSWHFEDHREIKPERYSITLAR